MEFVGAGTVRTRTYRRRSPTHVRRRALRRDRRTYRPQPKGQIYRLRRPDQRDRLVGKQRQDDAGAIRAFVPGFHCTFAWQDVVRPGSSRWRRRGIRSADARLHPTRLALAVHPHTVAQAEPKRACDLRSRAHDLLLPDVQGGPQAPRRPKRHGDRDRFYQKDRPDRRKFVCRRDQEGRLHDDELLSSRPGRHADALFCKRRAERRRGDLLRPVGDREDDTFRRPRVGRWSATTSTGGVPKASSISRADAMPRRSN